MLLTRLKKILLSVHFLGLVIILSFTFPPFTWPVSLPIQFWIKQGINFIFWTGSFYLNLYVLVPKVLYKSKGFLFGILIFLCIIVIALLNWEISTAMNISVLMEKVSFVQNGRTNHKGSMMADFSNTLNTVFVFGISTIIAVTWKINSDKIGAQDSEREKVTNELAFLKAQINPHFFFNILHTIYALTETNIKSAKDSIYTLSHMMRHVLYDTKNDFTTLEKEIEFVEDYIQLMQLRLTDQVQVIFDHPKTLKNVEVAPMLFLPFIENAYKHGISNIYPSYIFIGITQSANTMQLEVRNSIFNAHAENLEESNGIGLVNTKRRLDLIYPGRYELKVDKNEKASEFFIQLKLNQL